MRATVQRVRWEGNEGLGRGGGGLPMGNRKAQGQGLSVAWQRHAGKDALGTHSLAATQSNATRQHNQPPYALMPTWVKPSRTDWGRSRSRAS